MCLELKIEKLTMYLNSFSGNTPSVKMKKLVIEKKIDSLKIELEKKKMEIDSK